MYTYLETLKRAVAEPESAESKRFLADVGITHEQAKLWVENELNLTTEAATKGTPDPSTTMHLTDEGLQGSEIHPVVLAMHRFVDNRVVMPTRADVPVYFNDPKFALVSALKRFMYAFGARVMVPMYKQAIKVYEHASTSGDPKAIAAAKAVFPYALLGGIGMVLAAGAQDLKDLLKYEMFGQEPPTFDDKEGGARLWQLLRRSGVIGPVDMVASLWDDMGGGVSALLGPTASRLDLGLKKGFFSEEFGKANTPVLGQMPGFWRWLDEDEVQ